MMTNPSLEKKYSDSTITESEKATYKKTVFIKKILLEVLYLAIVITSFVKINRNVIFFRVLGGSSPLYIVAMVIFYLAMYAIFVYNTLLLCYIGYSEHKKREWLPTIHHMNVKLDLYTFVAKCLSILLFIMIYISTPCTIVGQSMEKTFYNGEKVLCSDLFYEPKVNDVVIFDAKGYTISNNFYIKRVVAVSGDTISKDNQGVYINGVLNEHIKLSSFAVLKKSANVLEDVNTFTVPEGMVMVMGDNYNDSYDSRYFGLVYEKDIFGKVFLRLFPLNKISFKFEIKED